VVREVLVEGVAEIPAVGQVETGGLDELPFGADPSKNMTNCSLKKTTGINDGAAPLGVQLPCPLAHEVEVELGSRWR
jgi:hypothetical protein